MNTPPEMDADLVGLTVKCDIWNLGILFYELYKKCHPFEADTAKEASKLIKKGFDGIELKDCILDDIIRC